MVRGPLTQTPWPPPHPEDTHCVSVWILPLVGVLKAVWWWGGEGVRGNQEVGGLCPLKVGHRQIAEVAQGHEGTGGHPGLTVATVHLPKGFQQPGMVARARRRVTGDGGRG